MYSSLDLAKYIVTLCIKENCPITNMQLQKILYYTQKAFLSSGERAFPEDIEAWKFGPAVPNVYYYFCGYGAMPITDMPLSPCKIEPSYQDQKIINEIVRTKRYLMPWDLLKETHIKGGAYVTIYNNGMGYRKTIPVELIKKDNLTVQ